MSTKYSNPQSPVSHFLSIRLSSSHRFSAMKIEFVKKKRKEKGTMHARENNPKFGRAKRSVGGRIIKLITPKR